MVKSNGIYLISSQTFKNHNPNPKIWPIKIENHVQVNGSSSQLLIWNEKQNRHHDVKPTYQTRLLYQKHDLSKHMPSFITNITDCLCILFYFSLRLYHHLILLKSTWKKKVKFYFAWEISLSHLLFLQIQDMLTLSFLYWYYD